MQRANGANNGKQQPARAPQGASVPRSNPGAPSAQASAGGRTQARQNSVQGADAKRETLRKQQVAQQQQQQAMRQAQAKNAGSAPSGSPEQDRHPSRKEIIEFLDSLPPELCVQTLVVVLTQLIPNQVQDRDQAEKMKAIFTSPDFVRPLKRVIEEDGMESALQRMAQLNDRDAVKIVEFFTGAEVDDYEVVPLQNMLDNTGLIL